MYSARQNLPLGLLSHSDQQRYWQTSVPQSRNRITGWAERTADLPTDQVNSNPTISMNIALVMGGGVLGGRLYGDYPSSLALGNPLDVGRGRLIPTLSVDEYSAELSLWFGLANDAALEAALPNIRNFYASGATSAPVGFLL